MVDDGRLSSEQPMNTLKWYPSINEIPAERLAQLIEDSVDWAHANGMVMRTATSADRSDICQTAPITLLPSIFPRKMFDEAINIQKAVSLIYFRVSWDFEFLLDVHKEVAKTDHFIGHMIDILNEVYTKGAHQKRTLLIQRNDYMCEAEGNGNFKLRQIEVNNIAASMGSLAERASQLHRRILRSLEIPEEVLEQALPDGNRPIDTIAQGIHEAWLDYGNEHAVVLFIVDEQNQNQIDQRHVEYRLDQISDGCVRIRRLTLTECIKRLSLDEAKGWILLLDDLMQISVVYFRSGYVPESYPSQSEWNVRRIIELSDAIKCPWIGLQLANTKKVQQVLSSQGEKGIERFLSDSTMCQRIRNTFAGLWGLETECDASNKIIKDAISHPDNYVLKPQLEGGLGNYYGLEVAEKLQAMDGDQLAAHILMERIRPMVVKNYLVKPNEHAVLTDVVSELGIYAYLYGMPTENLESELVHVNHVGGHIIRSKGKDIDKGGVAIGAAFIDSPFLF